MAKIYQVIQIKLNQFEKMSMWSLTYQQSISKHYHSDKHFSEFYLQDGKIHFITIHYSVLDARNGYIRNVVA